jgi:hypothetical protein
MATEAPVLTHCPNCGAKLHRTDLSLCAYCATPLNIGGGSVVDDETLQRLKRMREHASFPAAMAFVPHSPAVEAKAARFFTFGTLACVGALIAAGCAVWRGESHGALNTYTYVAVALAVLALVLLCLPRIVRNRHRAAPMLKRPAMVVVRRSVMQEKGGVLYYFTLRFDDGSEGEFQRLGQGMMYEPLSNGYSGIAYTRGDELIDFRRLT